MGNLVSMTNQVLTRPVTLTAGEQHELRELAGRAHALYEGLMALPDDAVEYRRDVWSEIVEIQDRITAFIPPATNSL
jgi:hypothetical protein